MASGKIVTLTKNNFEQEVINSEVPVLVDFWAEWCGPCRAVAPIMEELANEFSGKAKVGKVNIDMEDELAYRFKIMSIPTVILFKNGEAVERVIGVRLKSDFASLIEKHL